MNYELAKELKDAGFPQKPDGLGRWIDNFGQTYSAFAQANIKDALIPTLSELIEACGDGYFKLEHTQCVWHATTGLVDGKPYGQGSTPEEAVARLWLALIKTGV